MHTVLGAFVAGILVGQSPILTKPIEGQLRGLIIALFMPVFFGVAGLSINLTILARPRMLGLAPGLVAIASFGKLGGCYAGRPWAKRAAPSGRVTEASDARYFSGLAKRVTMTWTPSSVSSRAPGFCPAHAKMALDQPNGVGSVATALSITCRKLRNTFSHEVIPVVCGGWDGSRVPSREALESNGPPR